MKDLSEQTHYEVLELAPGCALDALTKAYAQAKERYAPGSLATYALAEPSEAEALLRRVEEAYAVLSNPDQRQAYDARSGIDGPRERERPQEPSNGAAPPDLAPTRSPEPAAEPTPAIAPAAAAPEAPPEPIAEPKPVRKTESELPADSAVTGDALRRVREARGLSLKDVEGRTKIGHWHLENIERERYADLPAQVYLRGFLMSFARELRLDPVRVAKSYLEQMKAKFQAKPE